MIDARRRTTFTLALTLLVVLACFTLGCGGAAPQTASASATPTENDFMVRINQLRQSKGLAALLPHPTLMNKARAWSAHMAAGGCGGARICHSSLPDGVNVSWQKLGENVGVGPSVDSLTAAFIASPAHYRNLVDPSWNSMGVGVTIVNGTIYVAEEFMQGDPPPPPPPVIQAGRSGAANPGGGFYTLNGDGTVTGYEGAPVFGSPKFDFDIARSMAVMPDGMGYVVLDGYGGVHKYGTAATKLAGLGNPAWPGWDIARSIAISPDGKGYAVLDCFGGVHSIGSAPQLQAGSWNWDIARSIAITPDGRGIYVLDGFGGIHIAGTAKGYGGAYWPGWDIARSIVVMPDGRGYATLDGFGGIHPAGSAPRPVANLSRPADVWSTLIWKQGSYLIINRDGSAGYS